MAEPKRLITLRSTKIAHGKSTKFWKFMLPVMVDISMEYIIYPYIPIFNNGTIHLQINGPFSIMFHHFHAFPMAILLR